jgi:plasmid stabilization system protein ParE
MAFRIVFARQALEDARHLFGALHDAGEAGEAADFIKRMQTKVIQIAGMPGLCPRSRKMKGIRRCRMNSNHVFYYRARAGLIEVIAIAGNAGGSD